MDTQELMDLLKEALENHDEAGEKVSLILSFEEAALMTRNDGLILRMSDGSEFQLTIVQSEWAKEEEEEGEPCNFTTCDGCPTCSGPNAGTITD